MKKVNEANVIIQALLDLYENQNLSANHSAIILAKDFLATFDLKQEIAKIQNLPAQGTPKTLDEAIARIITFKPKYMGLPDYAYQVLRDFLAQKFNVAYFQVEDDKKALAALEETFELLVKRL